MSRKLEEIYNEAVRERNKRMELSGLHNDSKMSVMNAITWVTSAAIYSFETIMDTFMVDLVKVFGSRINGTAAYYANAMLKWQFGDSLEVNEEGTAFRYPVTDMSKRIITHVSFQEVYNSHYQDNMLILKVATGAGNELKRITSEQLYEARKYLNQIKFAGVKCVLVSRKGDVLVPKITVYYDGAVTKDGLSKSIDTALSSYIANLKFDAPVYVQKIIDVIQRVDHVTDVAALTPSQGIFIAQYDDDDELGEMVKIDRKIYTSSGYIKQSTKQGQEEALPTFSESIEFKIESEE